MATTNRARQDQRRTLAISSGLVAGLATTLMVAGVIWASSAPAETVAGAGEPASGEVQPSNGASTRYAPGDCVLLSGDEPIKDVAVVACDVPHDAEITNLIEYTESDTFPGGHALSRWASEPCEASAETYIGTDILETTLSETMLVPTENSWDKGDRTITCYVADFGESLLDDTVKGRSSAFLRDETVRVSRLKPGDCFVPGAGEELYGLSIVSTVELVDCSSSFTGMLFGRDLLDGDPGVSFPGTDEVKALTGDRCSEQFREHFGVDSSGFNYRFFRPSQESWDDNDRSILCAILDENPIVGGFDATDYRPFFELPTGTCFGLGPEEAHTTVRITDMVLPVGCNEPHAGEMIESGDLEVDPTAEIPTDGVKDIAEERCEVSYTDYMGFAPFGSEYDTFPFWFPNDADWLDGDRRFACAFIGPDLPDSSLKGIGQNPGDS